MILQLIFVRFSQSLDHYFFGRLGFTIDLVEEVFPVLLEKRMIENKTIVADRIFVFLVEIVQIKHSDEWWEIGMFEILGQDENQNKKCPVCRRALERSDLMEMIEDQVTETEMADYIHEGDDDVRRQKRVISEKVDDSVSSSDEDEESNVPVKRKRQRNNQNSSSDVVKSSSSSSQAKPITP